MTTLREVIDEVYYPKIQKFVALDPHGVDSLTVILRDDYSIIVAIPDFDSVAVRLVIPVLKFTVGDAAFDYITVVQGEMVVGADDGSPPEGAEEWIKEHGCLCDFPGMCQVVTIIAKTRAGETIIENYPILDIGGERRLGAAQLVAEGFEDYIWNELLRS